MTRLAPTLLLVVTTACAHRVPVFPGPPSVVGRVPRAAPVIATPTGPDAPREGTRSPEDSPEDATALRIGDAARAYLRRAPPGRFRNDCSGFVCAVLDRVGIATMDNTAGLWARAEALGATHDRGPHVGDLVFFDDTYDRNGNGRVDDALTHVGVVIDVDASGTAEIAHVSSSKGRTTLDLNLDRPDDPAVNSWLRRRLRSDGPRVRYLAGQLVRGFATLDRELLESWARE